MKKVLIIDDEPTITEVIEQYAQKLGYASDSVFAGSDAMKKLSDHTYWAVFCDLGLPGQDGLEIFQEIKRNAIDAHHRFVLLTGTIPNTETEELVEQERLIVLRKPFNFRNITQVFGLLEARPDIL